MTRRAEIERLARFMGYSVVGFHDNAAWVQNGGHRFFFDPFTRLDDAMAVAEKFQFKLDHAGTLWFATVYGEAPAVHESGWRESPAEAITLAALAYLSATEGK